MNRIDWRSTRFSIPCFSYMYGADEADAERRLREMVGDELRVVDRVVRRPEKPEASTLRFFRCDGCGREIRSDWTDEAAEAEYAKKFPFEAVVGEERAIVCDDCYQLLTSDA